ncbi:armadillo-type protein [Schizophyllum amplum]|uniref:Armadillo-type protein n=1 Tax=Schizophyllum amplum TaxID=97359 RepID=A0A550C6Y3_9AGAR|nr:armadillo-type protein [Auriculariopsis ampla]
MDVQTLTTLFATSYNPDPNVRKAGELQIRKVGLQEGVITVLLQVLSADEGAVDPAARQAITVWIKNRVQYGYPLTELDPRRPDRAPISATDKAALKASILPFLASATSRAVSVQLFSTLRAIVAHDYPENWPTLTEEIKALLVSSNIREVHAGCLATLAAIQAWRYRQKGDNMAHIVEALFPSLVTIASQMLENPFNPAQKEEIPTLLHLILKSYKTSILVNLSAHQQRPESLVPWGRLLFSVVNLRLPAEVVPEDEEEREACEWWKAKKWAHGTLCRLFHRFGNPSQMPSKLKESYSAFAEHFVTAFAPEILKTYLTEVDLFVSNQAWLSKKCQYYILEFFNECTWTLLKPHVQNLIQTFVFPHLTFNTDKQTMWSNDQLEYVRVTIDEYEAPNTPTAAATTFLFTLVTTRTKMTFMPIMTFINQILNSDAPPTQRFGALNMTAALGPYILRHPEIENTPTMENFMQQYVLKQYQSPEPYMRSVALEILGTLTKSGLTWANKEHLGQHFHAIVAALDDPELPVRVQAALGISELVQAHEIIRKEVSPQIGKVIQDLLKLSEETDLDVLNHCMEVMVDNFQDELMPVATQLAQRLCSLYIRLAQDAGGQEAMDADADLETLVMDTGDEDKTFAAMGVVKTLCTVILAVDSSPEIMGQICEIIVPIIAFTLERKIIDLYDNMYDLLDTLTFRMRSVSPSLWPIFEQTYQLFKTDGIDFLDDAARLDNMLSYGSDTFKQRADYRQMVVDIYVTGMTATQLGDNDRVNACKLVESILLNLRGAVDDHLQAILVTALGRFGKEETLALRTMNLEVLINAVLYNPTAALLIMETAQPGSARTFIDRWFMAISKDQLPRVHDKKLSVLALSALLEVPPANIPDGLKTGWPGIVGGVLTVFKELPKAIEHRKLLEEKMEDDSDDDEFDDGRLLNLRDDDDDVWDEDSAYLEMLANESARQRERLEKKEADKEGDDESESDDENVEEELGYLSPLDNVNPYASFKQALTTFQMQNPEGYQTATTSLTPEQQTLLMEVMKLADTPQ